jgi:MFS family permease
VCGLLDTAYADGQLDAEEHRFRTGAATAAKTLGELRELVEDLQLEKPMPELRERAPRQPVRRGRRVAATIAALVLLGAGFVVPAGPVQLGLLAAGAFFAAGTSGPAGALVAELTPASIRASALGMLALANNLIGLAAGPLVTGALADRLGLAAALRLVPIVSLAAVVVLVLGRRIAPNRRGRTTERTAADF